MQLKANMPAPNADEIVELRRMFFKKLEQNGHQEHDGHFHLKDIERIKIKDIWLQRFLEQQDLNMNDALEMLWETCKWRKSFGANDINEQNINMDYVNAGLAFPRNRDRDGKVLFIFKSKFHIKGVRETKELLRIFVYWIERLQREEDYDLISILFDLAETGLNNLDLEYTKSIVNILKYYYPNAINYIFVYELPWILTGAFKIIKALMPPKAVSSMRTVNSKSLNEYVAEEKMLVSWGGKDDYTFTFEPEVVFRPTSDTKLALVNGISSKSLDTFIDTTPPNKKVHFANSEALISDSFSRNYFEQVKMLKITPRDVIAFGKSGNELTGTVEITNINSASITYKVKTTSPEKFRVRPSTGILKPGASITISVVLQQGHQTTLLLSKDKFLVMSMELSGDGNISAQEIADLWKGTSSNSALVEQHRLKCSIAPNAANSIESIKNGAVFNGNGSYVDDERQLEHISSSMSQIVDMTHRLEAQIKFNQTLQWITLFVFLLLSIAVVYIIKCDISSNIEYCTKRSLL